MSYTFEQLKEDVRKEAEALRVHATKEELQKLDAKLLRPESRYGCIYGSMTGDCDSFRAITLINKCACRFIIDNSFTEIQEEGFSRISKKVNGAIVENLSHKRHGSVEAHYSAIEAYILLPEANNIALISYLRGETETLEL
jgi:hypothetical protein